MLNKGVPYGVGVPLLIVNPGGALFNVTNARAMFFKGVWSAGSDMVLNGGEFNATGVLADMIMTPGMNDFVGGAVEVKINLLTNKIEFSDIYSGTKSLEDFGVDFAGGIIFGAIGDKLKKVTKKHITKAGQETLDKSMEVIEKSITDGVKNKMKKDDKGK